MSTEAVSNVFAFLDLTPLGRQEEGGVQGWVRHREEGRRYVYEPTIARDAAQRSALQNLVKTFFDGSVAQAMAALLDTGDRTLTSDEAERLARLIDQRKQEGR
jgi:predicted transcriptional regulator